MTLYYYGLVSVANLTLLGLGLARAREKGLQYLLLVAYCSIALLFSLASSRFLVLRAL